MTRRDAAQLDIRPIAPDDKAQLAQGFAGLAPESRYMRFFNTRDRLSDEELVYLTEVDHHGHEALVALDHETGEGVGVARFIRMTPGSDVADVAVAVADHWHGKGVGTTLLQALARRSREEGIRRWHADVLMHNKAMLDVFERLGDVHVVAREGTDVELLIDLPEQGTGALGPLLR